MSITALELWIVKLRGGAHICCSFSLKVFSQIFVYFNSSFKNKNSAQMSLYLRGLSWPFSPSIMSYHQHPLPLIFLHSTYGHLIITHFICWQNPHYLGKCITYKRLPTIIFLMIGKKEWRKSGRKGEEGKMSTACHLFLYGPQTKNVYSYFIMVENKTKEE